MPSLPCCIGPKKTPSRVKFYQRWQTLLGCPGNFQTKGKMWFKTTYFFQVKLKKDRTLKTCVSYPACVNCQQHVGHFASSDSKKLLYRSVSMVRATVNPRARFIVPTGDNEEASSLSVDVLQLVPPVRQW